MGTSRMVKLVALVVVGSFAAFVGTAGASPAKPPDRGNVNGTLVIGQLAPQTGTLSSIVQSLTTPVSMAIDEINAAGGVLGQPVQYTLRDDGTDPQVSDDSLDQMLATDKVDAIIGPASSGSMLGIIDKVRDNGVLDCSGSNTSADLSTANSGGYYFRTAPSDFLQGSALAQLVLKDGHKKVALLERNDSHGHGIGKTLQAALTEGGAKVVAHIDYDPDATSFDPDVKKVAAKKPDAVIVLGFDDDGSRIVRTMIGHGLGPQQIPIYTEDGMRTNSFASMVDPNNPGVVAGIKGTSPAASPTGVHSPFPEKFSATGVQPIFSAHYYDCTILTALAAEKAKSDDPAKMKDAFAANTRGNVKCNTYADCKKLLDAGKTIEYQGASAAFRHMNKFGTSEPKASVYEVWSFDDTGRDNTQTADTQIRVG